MTDLDFTRLQVLDAKPRVSGGRIGMIVALRDGPIVDFAGNPFGPQPARIVASLTAEALAMAFDARLPILLVFEDDDPTRPVVIDIVIDHPAGVRSDASLPRRLVTEVTEQQPDSPSPNVTIQMATIVGVEDDAVLVRVGTRTAVRAKTAMALRNLRDPVLLLSLPSGAEVIIGQLHASVPLEPTGVVDGEVRLRGSRVIIQADEELVLEAGACRVQLDARGKAVTTADQIVSRARGANKVQGGSVQLN